MIPAILDSVVARHANVRLSVNVSTYQLLDSQIRENLIEVARCGAHLALEWTEDPLAPDPLPGKRAAANFLSDLRNRFRVVVGIDDMGAGDDGIGRMILLDRSPDFVKLDGSVLHAVRARCGHEALVAEQIRAFRKLRVQVVGEHIENVGQLHLFTRRLDGPLVAASVGVAGARDSVNSAESAHCGDEAFGRRRAPS
jgi:EAL domain-containing protein (putative c-di-GMP-specific phosphodiesterase class I)